MYSRSAVSAGQIPGATGSCTGGSIRGPAAFSGITGHKPTYGLISKRGVVLRDSETGETSQMKTTQTVSPALLPHEQNPVDPSKPQEPLIPNTTGGGLAFRPYL